MFLVEIFSLSKLFLLQKFWGHPQRNNLVLSIFVVQFVKQLKFITQPDSFSNESI
jgi:hypothetical protein